MRRTRVAAAAAPAPRPELRKKVREALATLPDGRRATDKMLLDMVNALIPLPCTMEQMKAARAWNHDRGYVGYLENEELDRKEWFITSQGRVAELQA